MNCRSTRQSGGSSCRVPADPFPGALPAVMNCVCVVQASRSIGWLLQSRISNRHREFTRIPLSSRLTRCRYHQLDRRCSAQHSCLHPKYRKQQLNDTCVSVHLNNRPVVLHPRCSLDEAANVLRWQESLVVGWHEGCVGRLKVERSSSWPFADAIPCSSTRWSRNSSTHTDCSNDCTAGLGAMSPRVRPP